MTTNDTPQDYVWPAPSGEGWIDAWNGWYPTLAQAREEAAPGVGTPWILAYGEDLISQEQADLRRGLLPDANYRCPECDTYSGSFTLENGEVIHSMCGRAGSPASFTPGTPEYQAVYDHQEGGLFGDGVSYDQPEGYGIDEDAAIGEAALLFLNVMTNQSWIDIAPHLTCQEAEAAAQMLQAAGQDRAAEIMLDSHAWADDDPSDMHYGQGGTLAQSGGLVPADEWEDPRIAQAEYDRDHPEPDEAREWGGVD
jgi:hypothetical protein